MRFSFKPLLILVSLLAAGCYLPSNFRADIAISADGRYRVQYIGDLGDSDILGGRYEGAELTKAIGVRERDLGRSSGFTRTFYRGDGDFEVKFDKRGDIFRQKTIRFVDNGSKIATISLVSETGLLTVRGGSIPLNFHDQLTALGYVLQGKFTIFTDANVIDHNAHSVTGEEQRTYTWELNGFNQKPPKLVIDFGS